MRASRLLLCGVLWLAGLAGAGALPAAVAASASPLPPPLAQSSLLMIRATSTAQWLTLHISHAGDGTPVNTKDVTVSVAGHKAPVTALGSGTYTVPVSQLGSSRQPVLDITVGHDGIREVLSGQLTLAAAPAAPSGEHIQALWWVLNLGVVLVAAILFSRRKPAPKKEGE